MLKTLIKARLLSLFASPGKNKKKNGKKKVTANSIGKKILIGILAIYIIAVLFLAFGMIFFSLCEPYHAAGIDWFYFAFAGILSFAFMFIGSIFMTQSQLYDAKDNELLLSMPVPPKYILGSRIITLYLYNLLFEILVMLPAGALYVYFIGVNAMQILGFVVVLLLFPLLALALSCVLGFLLMAISSRLKNKSLFTMIFSIAFMLLYFYFYSNMNNYLTLLVNNGAIFAGKLKALTPLYWFGKSITDGNLLYLLFVALICIIPFCLVYMALSASFIKLVTKKRGTTKKKYQAKDMKVKGIKTALLSRELKHFTNSPVYMLNTGLGIIFLVVAIIACIVKVDVLYSLIAKKPEMEGLMALLLAAAVAFMATTNTISSTSVSLEGKTLPLLRSMPVKTKDILVAKLNMHLLITQPLTLVSSIVILVLFRADILCSILILILPAAMNIFIAVFGLYMNLLLPKLEWASEAVAVKQSASPMITMFAGFTLIIVAVLLYVFLFFGTLTLPVYAGIVTLFLLLVSFILYRYIVTKGCRRFEHL